MKLELSEVEANVVLNILYAKNQEITGILKKIVASAKGGTKEKEEKDAGNQKLSE